MKQTKRSVLPAFSVGNCKVEVEGCGFDCDSSGANSLIISFSNTAKIRISDNSRGCLTGENHRENLGGIKPQMGNGEEIVLLGSHPFWLVNPKDVDSHNKSLLEEILKIYMSELPSMAFAANTGKESSFLQRCVSNGRYRTLVLRSDSEKGFGNIIAAISYQIIPADTQFAEIPLAAVNSIYQNKGIGRLLYEELRKRLHDVGVTTIFCWSDKESEGFWLKQGFLSIGCVDNKGRTRRLPIKADIRRALCFPGCSTLMVTHLKTNVATPASSFHSNHCFNSNSCTKEAPIHVENVAFAAKGRGFSLDPFKIQSSRVLASLDSVHADKPSEDKCEVKNSNESRMINSSCSGQSAKRRVWEASMSSLKSKRIKGSHHVDCNQGIEFDLDCENGTNEAASYDCCPSNGCKVLTAGFPKVSQLPRSTFQDDENKGEIAADHNSSDAPFINGMVLKGDNPKVMFMNIADLTKKANLVKIVEELGGSVTCDGGVSTHVITGKARRTLNFCVALSSGAWVVSFRWLKESFRESKFLVESNFLLEDPDYTLKYKSELKEAIARAKASPRALLKGYQICVGKHVQPSIGILSAIIEAAGGNVIRRLCILQEPSKTIFVACEEDMEEALVAAKKGVWTYSSEWFMSCIMKQELDFEAPQFAESL